MSSLRSSNVMSSVKHFLSYRFPLWQILGTVIIAWTLEKSIRPVFRHYTNEIDDQYEKKIVTENKISVSTEREQDSSTDDDNEIDSFTDDDEDDYFEVKDDYDSTDGNFKMILCVNSSLGMGKGKIGAQCGHATLGAYQIAKKYCKSGLQIWQMQGQAKIAVKIDDDVQMLQLHERAMHEGLISYYVEDEGRTQIAAGSKTVLAIGPGPQKTIDGITGKLKLL